MELQRSVHPLSSSLTPLHNHFPFFYLIATVGTNRQNNMQIWEPFKENVASFWTSKFFDFCK